MFTRRHYQFVANVIAKSEMPLSTTDQFCQAFRRDNPRFDEARFINAVYAALLGEADRGNITADYLNHFQGNFSWAFRNR